MDSAKQDAVEVLYAAQVPSVMLSADCPELCVGLPQVRAFAKERAACDKYKAAVDGVLKYGLKSAAASGFFFGTNFAFATGKLIPPSTMPVRYTAASGSAQPEHLVTMQ